MDKQNLFYQTDSFVLPSNRLPNWSSWLSERFSVDGLQWTCKYASFIHRYRWCTLVFQVGSNKPRYGWVSIWRTTRSPRRPPTQKSFWHIRPPSTEWVSGKKITLWFYYCDAQTGKHFHGRNVNGKMCVYCLWIANRGNPGSRLSFEICLNLF